MGVVVCPPGSPEHQRGQRILDDVVAVVNGHCGSVEDAVSVLVNVLGLLVADLHEDPRRTAENLNTVVEGLRAVVAMKMHTEGAA